MGTAREWQIFIQGLLMGLIIFGFGPRFLKEVMENTRYVIEQIKKPAARTADRKKNQSKYSITNSCKDFYSQDIERWASDERN